MNPPIEKEMIMKKSKEIYMFINRRRNKNNKKVLNSIYDQVYKRYEEYIINLENLEQIRESNLKENEKNSEVLKYCYKCERKEYLKNEIIDRKSIYTCPYCNAGTVNTIDHYVPKTDYPEFSFFLVNLIPSCSECNSKKGERFNKKGEREFINFYYDEIPKKNF